jgi:hypothetical protein
VRTEAYFSEDRKHRYWLLRVWDESLPLLCVVGINPSTADERENDPTIRRCIGFAKRLGYGGLLMLNVGAYRSTDPRGWRKAADPYGPENTVQHLKDYVSIFGATCVVAAWGKNGQYAVQRCAEIASEMQPMLWCWGKNGDGTPRHPLMLPYSTPLEAFV